MVTVVAFGFVAMVGINRYFGERVIRSHAEALVEQGLQRTVAQLRTITATAAAQSQILRRFVDGQPAQIDPETTMIGMAPMFLANPAITYAGVALPERGDYAFLRRTQSGGIVMRSYTVDEADQRHVEDIDFDATGEVASRRPLRSSHYDPRTRPFFIAAVARRSAIWTDSYLFPGNADAPAAPGVTLATPVFASDGTLRAVLDVDFGNRELAEIVKRLQSGLPGRILVLEQRSDGSRRVVMDSAPAPAERRGAEFDPASDPWVAAVTAGLPSGPADGMPWMLEFNGEQVLVGGRSLAGEGQPNWLVLSGLPMAAVRGDLLTEQALTTLALLVIAGLGVLMSWFLSADLAQPLVRLTEQVETLAGGAPDTSPIPHAPEEVSALAARFHAMAKQVKRREQDLIEAQVEAEARAGRMQRAHESMIQAAQIIADPALGQTETFRQFCRSCAVAMQVTNTVVWRFDAERQEFDLLAGFHQPTAEFFAARSFPAREYPDYMAALLGDGRVITRDATNDPRFDVLRWARNHGNEPLAILDVGVFVERKLRGLFSFQLVDPGRPWTPEEEILASGMADIIALEFERQAREDAERRLRGQTERLSRHGAAMAELTRELGGLEVSADWCGLIPAICARALECDVVELRLAGADPAVFDRVSAYDRRTQTAVPGSTLRRDQRQRLLERLAGRRTLVVDDAGADADYGPRLADCWPAGTGVTLIDTAVISQDRVVGMLEALHGERGRRWLPEEELFLGAVAEVVSLRLETVARREAEQAMRSRSDEVIRLNEALSQVATDTAIHGAELDASLRCLMEVGCQALRADGATVWLRQAPAADATFDGYAVTLTTAGPAIAPRATVRSGVGALVDRLRRERFVVVPDTTAEPAWSVLLGPLQVEAGSCSLLISGVRSGAEMLGLVSFGSRRRPRPWSHEDQLFASAVADVLSLHLESIARREAEAALRRRSDRLKRMNAALGDIAINPRLRTSMDESLRMLTTICAEALEVERASIWLLRGAGAQERLELHNLYCRGPGTHEFTGTIARAGLESYFAALAQERVLPIAEARRDPRCQGFVDDYFRSHDIWSMLDASVRTRDQLVGVLCFEATGAPRPWTEDEQIFAGAVAESISLIIESETRRLAEMEAEESRDRISLLIDHAPLAIIDWDRSVRVRGWNPAAQRLFGYDGAEVAGRSGWFLIAPAEHGRMQEAWKRLLRTRKQTYERLECVTRDGRSVLCNWHNTVLTDRSGRLIGVISLVEDVTAKVKAEEALRQSRERLRLFVEGTPLAVVNWDRQIRIVGWNPAAERMFGHAESAVLGRTGLMLAKAEDRGRLARVWRGLTRGQLKQVSRFCNVTRDGREILCDWYNTVLRDERGRMIGVTSLIEDVTERVRAEQEVRELNSSLEQRVDARTVELQQANERLREVDRLKTEFLATMSHELRTPLNSIIGFSKILKQGMAGALNEEQSRQMERVHSAGIHLLGLINDLLDLSKIEAGRMRLSVERFDPGKLLVELEQMMRPLVAVKDLEFQVVNAAPGVWLVSDPGRLFQVLVNLANNAVKFTERGHVRITMRLHEDQLRFEVTDTGPGIEASKLDRLFEAFRQIDGSARRLYEGTGLGLYLSRKLVTLLGGTIGVDTEYGRGSTFHFWVPLRCESAPGPSSHSPFPHP